MQLEDNVKKEILDVFDNERLKQTAHECDFVQRSSSKIEGPDFIELLTTAIIENPYVSLDGLCDILSEINPNADMTPQGLAERINSEQAVDYLEKVLEYSIEKNLESAKDSDSVELFSSFNRVFLEDSTQCELNEKLADEFKGSGGSASKSALKANLIYELKQHAIREIHITDNKEPDQSLAGRIFKHLQSNDLIIRDLGYFALKALIKLPIIGAFFLSRLIKTVSVYLPNQDVAVADLGTYFLQNFPNQTIIDIDVFIGQKEKFPCRLVVYRLPEQVVNERVRKARKAAKKKGIDLTREQRNWLHFGFYVTNVERDVWSAKVIGTIYRIRWRIELIFKSWKSLLRLHVLKGTRPERIRCFLYGRLITVTIMTMLYSYANWYAEHIHKREVSAHKLYNWLKRRNRIGKAIFSGIMDILITTLNRDILRNCKQKRKRKTSLELIVEKVPYMESFDQSNMISQNT